MSKEKTCMKLDAMKVLKPIVFDLMTRGSSGAYVVGGYVRDKFLGIENKDVDVEVYGLEADEIEDVLSKHGRVDSVGKSFGVLKFYSKNEGGIDFDFSLPRTESKIGSGHKGFQVKVDKNLNFEAASSRRDFTCNSMGINLVTGGLLDPHNGLLDLNNKVLRATSPSFKEDVLRPLRAVQFAGRFDMTLDPYTANLCKSLRNEYNTLPLERVYEEWKKWALKSIKPSAGLQVLIDTGWSVFYPEFHNNIGVKQNPKFHGEIYVELHTQYVCDEAVKIAQRENLSDDDRLVLVLSALMHDCAKYKTSVGNFPDIRSPGHPEIGAPMAEEFLRRIGSPTWVIARVSKLVKNHMRHYNCASDKAVRKLAEDMEPSNISELCLLIEADYRGRGSTSSGLPLKAEKMLELSKKENVTYRKPKRIIDGKHLIELGLCPNPSFGVIIKSAYVEQIRGTFKDLKGGMEWLVENHQKISS